MASSKLLISIVIVLTLSFTTLSSADGIDVLCNKTANKVLCSDFLRRDPRSRGANVTVLTEILLEDAQLGADNIAKYYDAMSKLYSSGGEMDMALKLISCAKDLFKSLDEYNKVKDFFTKGDIYHASESASYAELDAEPCALSFKGQRIPKEFVDPIMTQIDLGLIIVYFMSLLK